ncbi:WhiB family transcriptional regulator [Streptomyces omiyaensis]|uniref:WhiB family transcriptional regulator n=1 Tax=Streptomyces omiyaensis TaxID=68247 RepID=UPI0036F6AFFF
MSETRGIATAQTPDWRALAACLGVDPDLMFPDPGNKSGTARAKSLCSRCPVRDRCLADAMADERGKREENRHGVRGGLTSAQRYHLHNRNRMKAKAST